MTEPAALDYAALLALVGGYRPARAVLTAVELDLFTALDGREADANTLAGDLGASVRGVDLLLHALAAIGVLSQSGDRFRNGEAAGRYLSRRSGEYRGGLMRHEANLWRRWSRLTDSVRTGRTAEEVRDGEEHRDFILAMHHGKADSAGAIVAALGLDAESRALDLGGGPGTLSIALAQAKPDLEVVLFDAPPVIALAREVIPPDLLDSRIRCVGGDFFSDDIGEGYDLVLLSSIVHIYGAEENETLIRKIYEATAPHGRIALRDMFLEPDRSRPASASLFSLNMLVNTAGGRSYTEGEVAAWLAGVGFYNIRRADLPGDSAFLIARK
jgi:SAM-dependent methyltransferase